MENQQHTYRSEVTANNNSYRLPNRPSSAQPTSSTSTVPSNRNPRKTLLSRQPRPQGVLAMKELQKTSAHYKANNNNSRPSSAASNRNNDNSVVIDEHLMLEGDEADAQNRIIRGGAPTFTPMGHRNSRLSNNTNTANNNDTNNNDDEDFEIADDNHHHHGKKSKAPKGPSIYDLSLMSPRAVIESASASNEASQFTVLLQPFKSSAIQGRASMYVSNCGGIVVNTPTTGGTPRKQQQHGHQYHHSSSSSMIPPGTDGAENNTSNNATASSDKNAASLTHLGTVSGAHPLHARFSVDRTAPAGTILGATAKVVCPQDEANFVVFVHDTQSKTTLSINMNVLLREERRASVQKDMQELRDSLELAKRHSDDLRAQLTRTANERDRALDRIRDVEIDVQRLTADRNRLSAKERAIEQDTERLRELEQRLIQQRSREDEQEQEMQQARARERDAMKQRETERQQERQQELERARERESERKAIESERTRMNAERIQYAKDRQAFSTFMKQVDAERAAFQEREQEWRSSIQSAMSDVAVCEACVSRKDLEKNVEVAIQRVKEMEIERDKMASELKKVVDAEASRLSSALSLGSRIPRNFALVAGSCETLYPLSQAQLSFRGAVHRGRIFIFIQPKKMSRKYSSANFRFSSQQQQQPGILELAAGTVENDDEDTNNNNNNQTTTIVDDYSKMKCLIGLRGSNSSHIITSISPNNNTHSNNKHSSLPGHSAFEDEMLDFDLTSHSQWLSSSGSTSVTSFFNESEAPASLLRLSVEPLPGSYCLDPNQNKKRNNNNNQNNTNKGSSFELDTGGSFGSGAMTMISESENASFVNNNNYAQNNIASSLKDLSKRVLTGWNQMKKRQELLGQVPISSTNESSPNDTSANSRSPASPPMTALERKMSVLAPPMRNVSFSQGSNQGHNNNQNKPRKEDSTASSIAKVPGRRSSSLQQNNHQHRLPPSASTIPSSDFDNVIKKSRYLQGWSIGTGSSHPTALLLNATPLLESVIPEGSQVLCFELAPGGTLGSSGVSHLLKHLDMVAYHHQTTSSSASVAAAATTTSPSSSPFSSSAFVGREPPRENNHKSSSSGSPMFQSETASPNSLHGTTANSSFASNNNNNSRQLLSPQFLPPPAIEMKLRFATCLEVTDEVDNVAHPLERVEEINACVLPAPPAIIRNNKLWSARDDCAVMKNVAKGLTTNLLYDARQERMELEKKILAGTANTTSSNNNTSFTASPTTPSSISKTVANAFTPAVFPFCSPPPPPSSSAIDNEGITGATSSFSSSHQQSNTVPDGRHPFQDKEIPLDSIVNVLSDVAQQQNNNNNNPSSGDSASFGTRVQDSIAIDTSPLQQQASGTSTSSPLDQEEVEEMRHASFAKLLDNNGQLIPQSHPQNQEHSSASALDSLEHHSKRYRFMQVQLRGDGNKHAGSVGDITIAPTNFDRSTGFLYVAVHRQSDGLILRKRVGRIINGTVDGIAYDEKGPKRSKASMKNWNKIKNLTMALGNTFGNNNNNNNNGDALGDTFGGNDMSQTLSQTLSSSMRFPSMVRRASVRYIKGITGEKTAIDTENGDFSDIRMIVVEFDNDNEAENDIDDDGGDKSRAGRYLSAKEMEQLRDAMGFSVCNFDEIWSKKLEEQQAQGKRSASKGGKRSSSTSASPAGRKNSSGDDGNLGIRTGTRLLHVTFAGVALFDPNKVYQQHLQNQQQQQVSNNANNNKNNNNNADLDNNDLYADAESCSVDEIEFLSHNSEAAKSPPHADQDLHHYYQSDYNQQQQNLYPRPMRIAFGANVAVTNSRGSLLVQPGPLAGVFRAGLRCNNSAVSKTPAPGMFLLPKFSLQRCLPSSPLPATLTVSMASFALDELFFDTSATSSNITIIPNTLCVDGHHRTVVFCNRCQIGIVEVQREDKLVVQLNGLVTASNVQEIVRCFAFRAGASETSAGSAALPRNVNVEMSIFGRTQWTDTVHLTAASPLISFPFDVPLSKTEGDPVADPIFNVSSHQSTTSLLSSNDGTGNNNNNNNNVFSSSAVMNGQISLPPEIEAFTNRSALAILVDIMPSSMMNASSSKPSSANQLPVQVNMSKQALLHSGLVLKTCRASSSSWPQQWLKRIAATATLQQKDEDARWMRERLSSLSSSSSSSSTNNGSQEEEEPLMMKEEVEIETFDLAASPTVTSFTSDEDAATVEASTGLNRVASIAFLGTGTLLLVFPSAAANWLDGSLAELANQGLLPVDLESPPLVKASQIQGALRSISAAVYSSLASASQCICSIRMLTEGNASPPSSSSAAGGADLSGADSFNSGGGGFNSGSATSKISPCTSTDYELRALEAQRTLQSAGSVVPRGRSIPMALHSFSSLLYIHAASTLTSISNVDTYTRGRFTAPPNSFGRALLAPSAQLSQAPLSWSRGLVNISVHIESRIPEGLEPVVLIHNESTYLGNTPMTMNNPANNNNNNSGLRNESSYTFGNNNNEDDEDSKGRLSKKDRPWFKLGVIRAVPEWETLLKLSKHSPKVFSVVSKNDLFGVRNLNLAASLLKNDEDENNNNANDDGYYSMGGNNDSSSNSDSNNSDDSSSTASDSSSEMDIAHDDSFDARRKRLQTLTSMNAEHILENCHNENFNVLCFNGRCVGTVSTNNFYDEKIENNNNNKPNNSKRQQNERITSTTQSPADDDFPMEEIPLASPPTQISDRRQSSVGTPGSRSAAGGATTAFPSGASSSPTSNKNRFASSGAGGVGRRSSVSSSNVTPAGSIRIPVQSPQQQQQGSASTVAPLFTATMTNLGAMEVSSFISSLQLVLRPSSTSAEPFGFEKYSALPPATSVRINVTCKPPSADATWSVDLNASTKIIWHSPPLVFDSGEPVPRYLFAKIPPSTQTPNGFNLSPFGLLNKRCHVANFGLMNTTGSSQALEVNEASLPHGTSVTIEALPSIAQPPLLSASDTNPGGSSGSSSSSSLPPPPSKIECSFDMNAATSDMGSSRHAFSLVPHADSVLSSAGGQQQLQDASFNSNSKSLVNKSSSSKSQQDPNAPLRHGAVYSGRTCIAEYDNIDGSCMSISQVKGNMKTKMLTSVLRSAQVSVEAVSLSSKSSSSSAGGGGGPPTSSSTTGRRKSITLKDGPFSAASPSSSSAAANRLYLYPSTTTVCVTFRDRAGGMTETYFIELFWPGSINTPVGSPFTILSIPRRRLQIAPASLLQLASQNSFTVAPSVFLLVGSQEPCRVGSDLFLAWGNNTSSPPNNNSTRDEINSSSSSSMTKLPRIYAEWSPIPVRNTLASTQQQQQDQQQQQVNNSMSNAHSAWVNSLERGVAIKALSSGSNNYFIPSDLSNLNNNNNNIGTMDGASNNNNSNNDKQQDYEEYYFGRGQFASEEEQSLFENWIKQTFSTLVSSHPKTQKQKAAGDSHGKRGGSRKSKKHNNGKDKNKNNNNSSSRPASSSSSRGGRNSRGNNNNNARPSSALSAGSGSSRPQSRTRNYVAFTDDQQDLLGNEVSAASFIDDNDSSSSPIIKQPKIPHFFQRTPRIHPSQFRRDAIRYNLISSASAFGSSKDDQEGGGATRMGAATVNSSNSILREATAPTTSLPAHWRLNWRTPTTAGDDSDRNNNSRSRQQQQQSSATTPAGVVEKLLFLETGTIRPEPCSDPIARIIRENQTKLTLCIDEIELASLIAFLCELQAIKSDLSDDGALLDLPLSSKTVKLFISSIVDSFFLMVSAEARPAGTGDAFGPSVAAADPSIESVLKNLGHFSFGVIWDANKNVNTNSTPHHQKQQQQQQNSTALCRRDIVADITADPRGAAEMFGLASAINTSSSLINKSSTNNKAVLAPTTQDIFLRNHAWDSPLATPFSQLKPDSSPSPLSLSQRIGASSELSRKLPNFMTNITLKFSFTLLCKDPVSRQKLLASILEQQQEALDEYRGASSSKQLVVRRRSTLANLGLLSLTDLGNLSATARPGALDMKLQNKDVIKSNNVTNAMNSASKLHPMPHLLIRWGFVHELDDPDDQSSAIQDLNSFDISRAPSPWANFLMNANSFSSTLDENNNNNTSQQSAAEFESPGVNNGSFGNNNNNFSTESSSFSGAQQQASILVSNIARPWEEVMGAHTINAEGCFAHGEYSSGYIDDEDTDFAKNEKSAQNLLMMMRRSSFTSNNNNTTGTSSISYSSDLRQIFSLPLSAASMTANNNGGSSLNSPLFVITQQATSKVVAAARYRVRTSSHLRHQVLNAAIAMSSLNNSNLNGSASQRGAPFSNFSFGGGTMMMMNNNNSQNVYSAGSSPLMHQSPQEQQQSLVQMVVKSQQQSDCELVVVFKDGYRVSRKALERLIGRVAVFPNTSYSGGTMPTEKQSGSNNNKGGFNKNTTSSCSSSPESAYHLFCACTVVDRSTDTVLARIENSEAPIVLHL